MEELELMQITIIMKSGRKYNLLISTLEMDWLFEKLMGRSTGKFQNIDNSVINIDEIEYLIYDDLEKENEEGVLH